jgi:tRNA(Ile)-lysidine synthase
MAKHDALAELAAVIRDSGLVPEQSPGIALISGGPDSACLAAALVEHCGRPNVHALHVNYGLRDDSDRDEQTCRALCAALRIDLRVERPRLGEGNIQAAAREARYAAAEMLRLRYAADWVATGHTRTDIAETVLYRLATSPGRRALLGLPPRRGSVVRPLRALGRVDARRLASEAGLPFVDDPSNLDPRFARNRIRHEVLPVLRDLSPGAETHIVETQAELAEESRVLDRVAAAALEEAGAGAGAVAVGADAIAELEPAVRRLALRALAERVAGREVPLGRKKAAEIWRLARHPEGGEVELGAGLRAVCEQGLIRFSEREEAIPEPARLVVPGSCRFGHWEVRAEILPGPVEPSGPELATLDADALGGELVVRAWRDGDRMRPLGMEGTKSLQDVFTDRKVPRSLRHRLPVVTSEDRVAWVAGVAVSEDFRITPQAREVAVLRAWLAGPVG